MNKKKWIVFSICLLLFILIMVFVIFKGDLCIDKYSYNLISKFINDDNTKIVLFITNFGSVITTISVTIIMILLFKNYKVKICILLNLLGIYLINNIIIKNIIARPRPLEGIIEERGYSFPSGHMAISTVVYGYLIFLLYKYIKNKYIKYISITILSIIIIITGVSRIYLNVHYTSDIIGAFLLGIIYLIVFITLNNKYIIKGKY